MLSAFNKLGNICVVLYRVFRICGAAGIQRQHAVLHGDGEGGGLLLQKDALHLLQSGVLIRLPGREHHADLGLRGGILRQDGRFRRQRGEHTLRQGDFRRHAAVRDLQRPAVLGQRQAAQQPLAALLGVRILLHCQGGCVLLRHGELRVLRQGGRGQDRHGEGQGLILIGEAPALREPAVLAVDVLGLSAGQGAGLVIAVVAVDMGFLAAEIPGVRRLVRAGTAQQGRILGIVVGLGGLAVQVALHHGKTLLRLGGSGAVLGFGFLPAGEDAHPVGRAVAVAVQENEVAGDRAL